MTGDNTQNVHCAKNGNCTLTHTHATKMPRVGLEPATFAPAAHTLAQLTKRADSALMKLPRRAFVPKIPVRHFGRVVWRVSGFPNLGEFSENGENSETW